MATRLGHVWLLLAATKALAAAPDPAPADKVAHARSQMHVLTATVQSIERLRPLAEDRAVRASCLAEKLAEARAGVQIGSDDLANAEAAAQALDAHPAPAKDPQAKSQADDLAHAVTRLDMLADRARELEHKARVCVDEDRSSVSVTRVDVEIPPTTSAGDPAALPPPVPRSPGRPARN